LGVGADEGHGAHVWAIDPWDLPGERYPFKWLNDPAKKNRKLFTIPDTREAAKFHIQELGLEDTVTLVQDFSVNAANNWSGPEVGLLFIDGDHREEKVLEDWEAWLPHLASEAIVAWDDYDPEFTGVVGAVDSIIEDGLLDMFTVVDHRLAVTKLLL
jgi:hypothetical protein